jgi:hypothetical protein
MLHHHYIEFLIYVCKQRSIHLLFFGDFFQLPPIPLDCINETEVESGEYTSIEYKFPSHLSDIYSVFSSNPTRIFTLCDNKRCDDPEFNGMLAAYRAGDFSPLVKYPFELDVSGYIVNGLNLYYMNKTVRERNDSIQQELNLPRDEFVHTHISISPIDNPLVMEAQRYLNGEPFDLKNKDQSKYETISLIKQLEAIMKNYGMVARRMLIHPNEKVMVRKNIYVDGSLQFANGHIRRYGEVSHIRTEEDFVTKFGKRFTVSFCPIVLAYAMTAHKVQGLSIMDDLYIDLDDLRRSNAFYPILYVALSRKKGATCRIYLSRPFNGGDIERLSNFRSKITELNAFLGSKIS